MSNFLVLLLVRFYFIVQVVGPSHLSVILLLILQGKVAFVSTYAIHQLHISIFVLAVVHVLYCIITLFLGWAKMRKWKVWEQETKTVEYQFSHDPERFRFARETSFGRQHLNFWSRSPVLIWTVCFFRQFVRSVPKVDYLTLRHATHTIILLVGTKLQVIITRMGLQIQDRGDVVKGIPVVQPADKHFWFHRPRLVLFLINFVLFQNAFQLAFFVWTWYTFGLRSCFHEHLEDVIIRISMGVLIQISCSYVTLPLHALVTQMGSNMKPTIFNETVATALRKWHHTARKHVKANRNQSGTITPTSPRTPRTPTHGFSPIHLLRHHQSEVDSRFYHSDNECSDAEGSPSPSDHMFEGSSYHQYGQWSRAELEREMEDFPTQPTVTGQHEINVNSADFSFAK
ncbi:MLO-like protein 6 [Magnolia sinica]|uniref:MLO-like protein 6 n=1 Tax=Magnolia sinica TaxID=86752 RepID=UPI002659E513|nr:MLO-like protein 6 [Magnolia sinica]